MKIKPLPIFPAIPGRAIAPHSEIQVFSRAACHFFYLCGSIAMQINPISYKFTVPDRLRIERLKYRIESDPKLETLEEFMTRLFPNFDLASLLELVDQVMAPTTTLPIDRVVEYDCIDQTLHFALCNSATVEKEMVCFERTEFPMIAWSGLPGMVNILRGADWHGELDLHNTEQFRNFSNYVFRS